MAKSSPLLEKDDAVATVPPPAGANCAYSANTRLATLPEEVLTALREQESDAALQKRTQSGTRRAVTAPRVAPPPPATPSFPFEVAGPPSGISIAPGVASNDVDYGTLQRPASEMTPIAIAERHSAAMRAVAAQHTPISMEMQSLGGYPLAGGQLEGEGEYLDEDIEVTFEEPRKAIWRSVAIVALFAFLGALVAIGITSLGP